MNTDAGVEVLEHFLAKSPRHALEVQIQNGSEHWQWRHGQALESTSPVFEIGSIGKVFTTTLLALLVSRGQVRLDDPVGRFLPALAAARDITLQQLASHTSGLPRDVASQWQLMRRGIQVSQSFTQEDFTEFLQQMKPVRKRGRRAHYSNLGMALLGRILGDVCGQTYADAVQDLILQPLEMCNTHVDPAFHPPGDLMQGRDVRGRLVPPFVWQGMEPAGVWRSTGDDMMRFLCAQSGAVGEPWPAIAERTTQPLAKISRHTHVGLGWMLTRDPEWGQVAWHNGGTFGQQAMAAWVQNPKQQGPVVVVLLSTRVPPGWHHLIPGRQLESLPQRLLTALATGASC